MIYNFKKCESNYNDDKIKLEKGGTMMKKEKIMKVVVASTILFNCMSTSYVFAYEQLDNENIADQQTISETEKVNTENLVDTQTYDLSETGDKPVVYVGTEQIVEGNVQTVLDKIETPIYQNDGSIKNYPLSSILRSHLSNENLVATKDEEKKTLTITQRLNGVFLTSDYINGKSEAGISYYNMMNFYATLLQAQQMLVENPDYKIIDNRGIEYDKALIDEFVGLVKQINDFDPTANLQYDWKSAYDTEEFNKDTYRGGTDVIATSKEGNISFEFHIDAHSWWGYDLGAHDSITGLILGLDANEANEKQHELTMAYANFFVIKMKENDKGTWYMLNGTDLENPMIYVSKDGKEAFMIDVDFYGANALNSVIKSVIGNKCESLKIFLTHNHADHVNNLAVIGQDKQLREMTTIIWPENEPHTILSEKDGTVEDMVGKDLVSDIVWKEVITVKDMEKFTVANTQFQFIEIPNEHTPGGGQLADLTNKVIYSGDSLGAQVHLGGTTITADNAQAWLDGAKKVDQYIEENGIQYNIGGHTPYLNNPKFASWLAAGIEYAMENAQEGYNLIIVENGVVVNETDRYGEIMGNGLSDRDELNICSLGYIQPASQQPENPDEPVKPSNPTDSDKPVVTTPTDTNKTQTGDKVKTGDETNIMGYAIVFVLSILGLLFLKKRRIMK